MNQTKTLIQKHNRLLILEDLVNISELEQGNVLALKNAFSDDGWKDLDSKKPITYDVVFALHNQSTPLSENIYSIPLLNVESTSECLARVVRRFLSKGEERFFVRFPNESRPYLYECNSLSPTIPGEIVSSKYYQASLDEVRNKMNEREFFDNLLTALARYRST